MTFFLDQDVPDDLARWLRHRGHVVTCLREVLPTTVTDSEAWQWALAHGAVFVSCNRNDVLALRPEGAQRARTLGLSSLSAGVLGRRRSPRCNGC